MYVTTVRCTFIDGDGECGIGEGAKFRVALTFDGEDQHSAQLKEVFFREITDGEGWRIYSSLNIGRSEKIDAGQWDRFDRFIHKMVADNMDRIAAASFDTEMIETQRNEKGYYDEF